MRIWEFLIALFKPKRFKQDDAKLTECQRQLRGCKKSLEEKDLLIVNLELDRIAPPPVALGKITPNDMYPLILAAWPNAIKEGKVKVRSGKYALRTWDSIEAFALHTRVANQYRPFKKRYRGCSHFAADLAGQFYHNKSWQGQAIGTIIYKLPGVGRHEVNIVFGGDPPTMRFWEPREEIWTTRVLGTQLDMIWIP